MLRMLDNIERKLGIQDSDPELTVLEKNTDPEKILNQIDKVLNAS